MTPDAGRSSRVFPGWLVVLGAFGVTFFGFGSAYTFSAFLEPLQTAFAASRGAVSTVFSGAGCLYFALGIVSGPLADQWGARKVAAAGMATIGAGLLLAALAQTLLQVLIAYGLGIGIGVGLAYVPALGAVQRWFTTRRGFASGLAVSGIGVGTLVMPPLATSLIEHFGWRSAYAALGLLVLLVGGAMSLWIDDGPATSGMNAEGAGTAGQGGPIFATAGLDLGQAVRTPHFRYLYLACLACSFGVFVPFVHLVPYARDHGVATGSAVWLLGAVGLGSTAGRFLLGGVADRLGRRRSLLLTYVALAATMLLWAVATSFPALVAFAVIFGLLYGGWVALLPAMVMDVFGGRRVSSILGALYTSVSFGTLLGPAAAGYAFDLSASYRAAIVVAAALNLLAAALTLRVPSQAAFGAASSS